jgi:hypothetical protein
MAKSKSKAKAPKSKQATGAAPAPAAPSAVKSEQLSLDAQPPARAEAAPPEPEPPRRVSPSEQVAELVIGANGTWKKMGNGKKVQIDDQEWLLELGRMLARKYQADSAAGKS